MKNNEKKWCTQAKCVARVCVWNGARILFRLKIKYEYALHDVLQRNMYIARCTESIKWTMSKDFRRSEPNTEHGPGQPTPTDARVHVFMSSRIRCRKQ